MKRVATTIFLFLSLMLAVPQFVYAGGADPVAEEPQYDSRICGRDGTTTAASTTRWTNIFSNGDPDTDTGRAYPPATQLRLIGRDFWGCWVQVESNTDAGNGWVPIQSLNTLGVLGLTVTYDNSNGCEMIDGQIMNCNDSGTSSDSAAHTGDMTSRWTNLYSSPDQSSATGMALPPNTPVTIVSTSGSWVQITSDMGNGWVPANSLK